MQATTFAFRAANRNLGAAVLCLLALLIAPLAANAQVLYGSLTGNVVDPANAAVAGAKVEAQNVATGVEKRATTDERGSFAFGDLQTGTYKLTITAASFRTLVREGVVVNANTVVRADARLEISQVSESVTVPAASVALQSDRADVNMQIQKSMVANLPINSPGRNFQSLYRLVPGITPPAEANSDAGNPQRALTTYVNGVTNGTNSTRLDGATITYPWLVHNIAYVPPADAVETVNIVTNSFDAEQGMAGGSAVNVTIKSGTNSFHGSLHDFNTNSRFNARNYFY